MKDNFTEYCSRCGKETDHEVWVEIVQENTSDHQDSKFSNEPCRFRICQECGFETNQRMNNSNSN